MLTLSRRSKHALTSRSAVKFSCKSFRLDAGGACIALQSMVETPVMIQNHKDLWLDMKYGAHPVHQSCQCICAEYFWHPFDNHANKFKQNINASADLCAEVTSNIKVSFCHTEQATCQSAFMNYANCMASKRC